MQPSFSLFSIAALVTLASALPLNINLGAYSPALVVGDGAIEFEGEEAAEGRAVVAQPAGAAPPVIEAAAAPAPFAGPILNDNTASLPIPGVTTQVLDPREPGAAAESSQKARRDLAGFDRALQYAEVGLTKGPDIQLGTGAHGAGVGIIVDNNQAARSEAGVVVIGS